MTTGGRTEARLGRMQTAMPADAVGAKASAVDPNIANGPIGGDAQRRTFTANLGKDTSDASSILSSL